MPEEPPSTFGPNAWLVDEMYDRYKVEPASVSESWQEFFGAYPASPRPVAAAGAPATNGSAAAAPAAEKPSPSAAEPLRGAAAAVVKNMTASLTVPTATSVRPVPAKLLEVNRKIANNHLQ